VIELAHRTDKIYVFSVANMDFGRIVASVDRSGNKVDEKNIFDVLGIARSESTDIRDLIFGYGKRPYATACGNINKRVAFFFKHFAYDTSLCLVIVPAISAKRAAGILNSGVFEDVIVSDALTKLVPQTASCHPLIEDSDVYLYLARLFGQIMDLLELGLQYASESIPTVRAAAEGIADLLGLSLDFNTRFEMEDDLIAVDEIYDGRFCAAALLVTAIMAAKRSADSSLSLTEIRGLGGIMIEMSFECQRYMGFEAIDHLKMLAEINHGIRFEIERKNGRVYVSFLPLYQDVGFVGVKNGDEIFDIVAFRELY
jgi:hypothetical protein